MKKTHKEKAGIAVRCVGCGQEKTISFLEAHIHQNSTPLCDKCWSPMVAVSAEARKEDQ